MALNISNFLTVLSELRDTTKKKKREELVAKFDPTSITLINFALNPFITFGIKKFPKCKHYADVDGPVEPFVELLRKLAARELTGNAAKDAVVEVMSHFTESTALDLSRIIWKDLKAGFSAETLNKVHGVELVPVFKIMLAARVDEKYKWTFPCQAEIKYDGQRVFTIVNGPNDITHLSRSGLEASFVNGVFDDELIQLYHQVGAPFVVDGEVMGETFRKTMNAKKEGNLEAVAGLNYHIFDFLSFDEFMSGNFVTTQTVRTAKLNELLLPEKYNRLFPSVHRIIHNFEDAKSFFDEIVGEVVGEEGEGLIIKQLHGVYERDRSKFWHKWKPVIDVDLVIEDFYEGEPDSKYVGMLGGIIVSGEDENGNKIRSGCGSGFSDEERIEIWNNKEKYRGLVAKIEAGSLSWKDDPNVASLRFAVFCHIRYDKCS